MKNATMSGHVALVIIREMLHQHHSKKYPILSPIFSSCYYDEVRATRHNLDWSDGSSNSELRVVRRYDGRGEPQSLCGFHLDSLQYGAFGELYTDGEIYLQTTTATRVKVQFMLVVARSTLIKFLDQMTMSPAFMTERPKIEEQRYDSVGSN
jgi:hypothetical protein